MLLLPFAAQNAEKTTFITRILDAIEPLFSQWWGYLIVFGVAFLEHSFMLGLVVPGDVVLLLGAFYAGEGNLNIVLVVTLAFVGSVAGDNLGYFLGRRLGRPILDRHGDFMKLGARVLYVEKYFAKYGGWTVFIARFVTFVGTLACPVAGMSKMKYKKFIKYEVAGSAIWAAAYGTLGYIFAQQRHLIARIFNYIGNTLLLIFVSIAVIAYVVHRVRKRREFEEELEELKEEQVTDGNGEAGSGLPSA